MARQGESVHPPGRASPPLHSPIIIIDPVSIIKLGRRQTAFRAYPTPFPSPIGFSLPFAWKVAYNKRMEISFAPELEAKLNRIASQTGKGPDEVVRELVASYLDHDEWFRKEVGKGLASLDHGKTVSHEDVRRQMDRILGS
jgi:predicted transcriptional regulator